MKKISPALERLLLTLWVGSFMTAGLIVAPAVFATLEDSRQAGDVAGRVFHLVGVLGMVCVVGLMVLRLIRLGHRLARDWRALVLLGALILIGAGLFVLQPRMADLRATAPQGLAADHDLKREFDHLHRASTAAFVMAMLLGLVLVVVPPEKS